NKYREPSWFHNVKLGVIVHWGPYSVPGWATPLGEFSYIPEIYGWKTWFAYNPYAEWYHNTMKISGSPTAIYHTYVHRNRKYEDFAKIFEEESNKWRASDWVNLFIKSGIKYVILVTKHHDGYLLWPSDVKNPRKQNWYSSRDLVGELAKECKAKGLRFATYYSSGIDWTFNDLVIADKSDIAIASKFGEDYREYILKHWLELIERYKPFILWNDMGYPFEEDLPKLFAYYYNTIEEGLINDRFTKKHHDFITPEYKLIHRISEEKWETVRGLGYSFGYNRAERKEHTLSIKKAVHLLIDVVSKNGNLLIGITPKANGTIPKHQYSTLLEMGLWLQRYGESIYGTQPWIEAEGIAIGFNDAIPLRFTVKEDVLYVFLLGKPRDRKLILKTFQGKLEAKNNTYIDMIGEEYINWVNTSYGIEVEIPRYLYPSPAYVIKIDPIPNLIM
ncbi:MAG: alpha-L-fucosidase, partial [Ignisphaera sp.]